MSRHTEHYKIVRENATLIQSSLSATGIIDCVVKTNQYIANLYALFDEMHFDLFSTLGQRNISGVIGAIFSQFFCMKFGEFCVNPHPDGRPDLLSLSDKLAFDFYHNECFQTVGTKLIPIKSKLSPFPHLGIEVKCTIGSHIGSYKKALEKDTGKSNFSIGLPRISYLEKLNFWAHHVHSANLLGLYYDYYAPQQSQPQILAVLYTDLAADNWNKVSLGSHTAKKTSNTSLNASGIKKLYQGCLAIIKDDAYIDQFTKIGIAL